LDIEHVSLDGSEPTGASLIQTEKNGDKQMMVSFAATHKLSPEDIQAAAKTIQSAKILLTQLEIPVETVLAAMHIAHEAGVQIIFDPAPPISLPDELFPMVNIIKPDTSEAEFLTGIHVQDRDSARQAAKALLQRGVQAASVQAGHKGNLIVWQDGECWLPQIEVKSVDATGAGDTFAAALAVKLAEGSSLCEAGQFANAAAALSTTKFGARPALPYRDEVEKLVAKAAYKI
jgi:ribokinase